MDPLGFFLYLAVGKMNLKKYTRFQLFLIQLIAVFVWFLITVVQWSGNPKNSPGLTIPLIVRGVEALAVLIMSSGLIFLAEHVRHRFRRPGVVLILVFIFLYFFAIAANVISLIIRAMVGYSPPAIEGYFFIQSLHFYIPLFLVYLLYWAVKHRIEWYQEREEKLKAESLAQEAKWMMLSYQVNPHFLFNALNSIRALIGLNDEKARSIVTRMSEYFRYSLSIEHKTLVPLSEEIAAVDSYLEIQMIRYPERLQVTQSIEESTLQCLVPVFTIQTLIENAIKYGLKTHPGVVDIEIRIRHQEEKLHICISNSGKLVDPLQKQTDGAGTQTGLENLKSRLEYLDKDYRFMLEEEGELVVASIMLNQCKHHEELESPRSG